MIIYKNKENGVCKKWTIKYTSSFSDEIIYRKKYYCVIGLILLGGLTTTCALTKLNLIRVFKK